MRKLAFAALLLASTAGAAHATDALSPITPERARAILGFLGSATLRGDQTGLFLDVVQALNAVASPAQAAPPPPQAGAKKER